MKYLLPLIMLAALPAGARSQDINDQFNKVSAQLIANDVQTIVIEDVYPKGNCLPDGASYMVALQVKKIAWDDILEKDVEQWVTTKTVNVSKATGRITQYCD
ncbi:hypothetical protein [Bdellovibrio sp. HCB288]|uniref:hypothetical protein n=1 Tax=Bdellovibrio sp. HCB288 TaxID=3394355 RepID=UPI0039B61917